MGRRTLQTSAVARKGTGALASAVQEVTAHRAKRTTEYGGVLGLVCVPSASRSHRPWGAAIGLRWPLGEPTMSEPAPATISREAGDKTKGFRFQKLRAAIRLLERIAAQPATAQTYCALEFIEDSAILAGDGPVCVEENKQYSSSLSFNSPAIKNSIVAFLDSDAAYGYSKGLHFGLYASAEIADERLTLKTVQEVIPGHVETSFQLLRKLAAGARLSDVEVALAKRLIEDEYVAQYTGRGNAVAVTPPFAGWSAAVFRTFLEKIDWMFATENNDEIEGKALELVRKCSYFDHRHEGLEKYLLPAITDLLEKRSHQKSPIERIVGTSDIRLLFLEILAQCRDDKLDPAHLEWDNEIVIDRRNLSQKVLAVAPSYSSKRLARLARKIAVARQEKDKFGREYVSLLLRVLHVCQDEFEKLADVLSPTMSEAEVDVCLEKLVTASVAKMNTVSLTWSYSVANEDAIRGAVLTLFDDCYLAFDNAAT